MSFSQWFKNLPWDFKFVIVVMMFRPFIDQYYSLSIPGLGISPLEVFSGLTYIALISGVVLRRSKAHSVSGGAMRVLGYVFTLNLLLSWDGNFSIWWLSFILKSTFVFVLYGYYEKTILFREDVLNIFKVYGFGAVVSAGYFVFYALTAGGETQVSRGFVRFTGGYADIFIISIYTFIALALMQFFYYRAESSINRRRYLYGLLVVNAYAIFVLLNINHNLSNIVYVVMTLMFLAQVFKVRGVIPALLSSGLIVVALFYYSNGADRFVELLGTEMEVARGDEDAGRMFHGRMDRWMYLYDDWQKQNTVSLFLGASLSDSEYKIPYFTGITHNEYLRMAFSSGIVGFGLYLFFIVSMFISVYRHNYRPLKFMGYNLLVILFLFSFTSVPLMYQSLMLPMMALFVYISKFSDTEKSND